jgi:antibiotic biosynthesis monooxygenase (ABM) superfamily enzyme
MITCYLRYEIDPDNVAAFEAYAKAWIALIPRFGGTHHGVFLPGEGPSDVAMVLFSFPSLSAYEAYKIACRKDPDCIETWAFARKSGFMKRYDRLFFRPEFDGDLDAFREMHRALDAERSE